MDATATMELPVFNAKPDSGFETYVTVKLTARQVEIYSNRFEHHSGLDKDDPEAAELYRIVTDRPARIERRLTRGQACDLLNNFELMMFEADAPRAAANAYARLIAAGAETASEYNARVKAERAVYDERKAAVLAEAAATTPQAAHDALTDFLRLSSMGGYGARTIGLSGRRMVWIRTFHLEALRDALMTSRYGANLTASVDAYLHYGDRDPGVMVPAFEERPELRTAHLVVMLRQAAARLN